MLQETIRPENLTRFINKSVRVTQSNHLIITGKVTGVRIENHDKPDSITLEQNSQKSTKVGKLKRVSGLLTATVYLKNIIRVEVL